MAVSYRFRCDTCGKESDGEWTGDYVHPLPPFGWEWQFGPGLEGPHVCSPACQKPLAKCDDGRWRLWHSHIFYDKPVKRERAVEEPILSAPPSRPAPRVWYVYFIQQGDNGPVKIGRSHDVAKRLVTLQIGCPDRLHIRYAQPAMSYTESILHERFAEFRVQGDWFKPEVLQFAAQELARLL